MNYNDKINQPSFGTEVIRWSKFPIPTRMILKTLPHGIDLKFQWMFEVVVFVLVSFKTVDKVRSPNTERNQQACCPAHWPLFIGPSGCWRLYHRIDSELRSSRTLLPSIQDLDHPLRKLHTVDFMIFSIST